MWVIASVLGEVAGPGVGVGGAGAPTGDLVVADARRVAGALLDVAGDVRAVAAGAEVLPGALLVGGGGLVGLEQVDLLAGFARGPWVGERAPRARGEGFEVAQLLGGRLGLDGGPQELRDRAVKAVEESGRPIAQVAKDMSVGAESLRSWVRQAQRRSGSSRATTPTTPTTARS